MVNQKSISVRLIPVLLLVLSFIFAACAPSAAPTTAPPTAPATAIAQPTAPPPATQVPVATQVLPTTEVPPTTAAPPTTGVPATTQVPPTTAPPPTTQVPPTTEVAQVFDTECEKAAGAAAEDLKVTLSQLALGDVPLDPGGLICLPDKDNFLIGIEPIQQVDDIIVRKELDRIRQVGGFALGILFTRNDDLFQAGSAPYLDKPGPWAYVIAAMLDEDNQLSIEQIAFVDHKFIQNAFISKPQLRVNDPISGCAPCIKIEGDYPGYTFDISFNSALTGGHHYVGTLATRQEAEAAGAAYKTLVTQDDNVTAQLKDLNNRYRELLRNTPVQELVAENRIGSLPRDNFIPDPKGYKILAAPVRTNELPIINDLVFTHLLLSAPEGDKFNAYLGGFRVAKDADGDKRMSFGDVVQMVVLDPEGTETALNEPEIGMPIQIGVPHPFITFYSGSCRVCEWADRVCRHCVTLPDWLCR